MTLPDLLERLTVLAERVSHDDRFVLFEAMRRLRHGGTYVRPFGLPTPEQERFWNIKP